MSSRGHCFWLGCLLGVLFTGLLMDQIRFQYLNQCAKENNVYECEVKCVPKDKNDD